MDEEDATQNQHAPKGQGQDAQKKSPEVKPKSLKVTEMQKKKLSMLKNSPVGDLGKDLAEALHESQGGYLLYRNQVWALFQYKKL